MVTQRVSDAIILTVLLIWTDLVFFPSVLTAWFASMLVSLRSDVVVREILTTLAGTIQTLYLLVKMSSRKWSPSFFQDVIHQPHSDMHQLRRTVLILE